MIKNIINLCDKDERKVLFSGYLTKTLPGLSFDEYDDSITFLCEVGLSDQWLNVVSITIGEHVCPNRLTSETPMIHSVDIKDLLTLAKELRVFDDKTVKYYVKKLNVESFSRISTLSEIKIGSSYRLRGYEIEIEPPNRRIGKSGLEGKADLRVNFKGEWIYIEITQENYDVMNNSHQKISDIAFFVKSEIEKYDLLPWRTKIDAVIINKNRVLSSNWRSRLVGHLKRSPVKLNTWKNYEGIRYRIRYCAPDEPVFSLGIPLTNIKKYFGKKLKEEANQIPSDAKGIIAIGLNSTFNIHRFGNYAQELLARDMFDHIIAIVIWYQQEYRIIYKKSVNRQLIEFIQIPFIILYH